VNVKTPPLHVEMQAFGIFPLPPRSHIDVSHDLLLDFHLGEPVKTFPPLQLNVKTVSLRDRGPFSIMAILF